MTRASSVPCPGPDGSDDMTMSPLDLSVLLAHSALPVAQASSIVCSFIPRMATVRSTAHWLVGTLLKCMLLAPACGDGD